MHIEKEKIEYTLKLLFKIIVFESNKIFFKIKKKTHFFDVQSNEILIKLYFKRYLLCFRETEK